VPPIGFISPAQLIGDSFSCYVTDLTRPDNGL